MSNIRMYPRGQGGIANGQNGSGGRARHYAVSQYQGSRRDSARLKTHNQPVSQFEETQEAEGRP